MGLLKMQAWRPESRIADAYTEFKFFASKTKSLNYCTGFV